MHLITSPLLYSSLSLSCAAHLNTLPLILKCNSTEFNWTICNIFELLTRNLLIKYKLYFNAISVLGIKQCLSFHHVSRAYKKLLNDWTSLTLLEIFLSFSLYMWMCAFWVNCIYIYEEASTNVTAIIIRYLLFLFSCETITVIDSLSFRERFTQRNTRTKWNWKGYVHSTCFYYSLSLY